MNPLENHINKIKQHLQALVDLEKEYSGRPKSNIYLQKSLYHKQAAEHWRDKLYKFGKESSIIRVRFFLRKLIGPGPGVYRLMRFETLLVGVNNEMAKQLILLDNPEAIDFTFEIIEPGILKEI